MVQIELQFMIWYMCRNHFYNTLNINSAKNLKAFIHICIIKIEIFNEKQFLFVSVTYSFFLRSENAHKQTPDLLRIVSDASARSDLRRVTTAVFLINLNYSQQSSDGDHWTCAWAVVLSKLHRSCNGQNKKPFFISLFPLFINRPYT